MNQEVRMLKRKREMKRLNITLVTLFVVLFLRLPFTLAAQCLPDLGNGNICTAKDFILSEILISGPTSCTEGEIISQPITVRFGIQPTAGVRPILHSKLLVE